MNILLLILMSIFDPIVYTTYEYGPTDNFDRSTVRTPCLHEHVCASMCIRDDDDDVDF